MKTKLLLFCCSLACSLLAAEKPSRPNILFIMSDDHGAHSISAYGSRVNKTPHLDALAARGARLQRCYATNPICAPSRACILSGMYSHKNGVPTFSALPRDVKTVGGYLRDAGYYTAHIGKWHLGGPASVRDGDWDHWMNYDGLGQYRNPFFFEKDTSGKVVTTRYPGEYATENLTKVCKQEVDRALASGKPFFLMMHHKAPHSDWIPSPKYRDKFRNLTLKDIPPPETLFDDFKGRSSALPQTHTRVFDHLNGSMLKMLEYFRDGHTFEFEGKTYRSRESVLQMDKRTRTYFNYLRMMQDYLACVQSVDDSVGEMMDHLKAKGVLDNTVVIYTSDQGFFLGDHGMWGKRYMFEETMKMPFLISYPGVIKPGTVVEDLVINEDFAPLFLELAGAEKPKQMQGESFLPCLKGETPASWRTSVYGRGYMEGGWKHTAAWNGVKTKTDELIHYYKRGEWEYYDLATDRHEMKNRMDDPACQARIGELQAELRRLKKYYDDNDEFIDCTETNPDGKGAPKLAGPKAGKKAAAETGQKAGKKAEKKVQKKALKKGNKK